MSRTRRRAFLRAALLAGAVVLGAWLARTGRAHTLFLDNAAVTLGGQEHPAPGAVEVSLDGGKPEVLEQAERAMRQVVGPVHRLAIEVRQGPGGPRRVEREIRLPFGWDAAVVSLPAALAGAPAGAVVTRWQPPPPEDAPAEQMIQQKDADVLPQR
ncbi:MAG: hypothetical protein HZB56_21230 [Deltaproteobacteria bacterium]|nr:hypothetical protein [Deltaproteobacteria bacterium]